MNDRPDQLPKGWGAASLGPLLIDVQPGFACGSNSRDGDGVPHLRPMNITRAGQVSLDDLKRVPPSSATAAGKWAERGDVLFNNTNSPELVGKTAVYNLAEPRAFSNHITRLRTRREALAPAYCAAFLHHSWSIGLFEQLANNHVSQASVGREVLESLSIPLPPLAEQRRIIVAIERLTARVDTARERLARVPAILKRFRQSVLAASCSGRLTSDWRERHTPAETATQTLSRVRSEEAGRYEQHCDRAKTGGERKPTAPAWAGVAQESISADGVPVGWCQAPMAATCSDITVGYVGPMADEYVPQG